MTTSGGGRGSSSRGSNSSTSGFLPRWARAAALLCLGLGLLITLPWEGQLDHEFEWDRSPVPEAQELDRPTFTRELLNITSRDGTRLEAWVYLPKGGPDTSGSGSGSGSKPPVLLMAHGMGAQKDIGLFLYGEKFVEAGIATLIFDYRCFGGSDGTPRHWVSPRRHLQDWEDVIAHVQATNLGGRVDASRLALWGVSYAGGHVLVMAAKLGRHVSAVIANEPYVSPQAVLALTSVRGVGRSLRLLAAGLSDELRRRLGELGLPLAPVYLRLVAPMSDPKALALLPLQDSELASRSGGRPASPRRQGGWQNKVLARVVVEALGYNPSRHFSRVTAPVFLRVALLDHLCPPSVVRATTEGRFAPGQLVVQERNTTHLEAHASGVKDSEIAPAIEFLRRHLGLAEAAPAAAAAAERAAEGEREAEQQFPEVD